MTYLDDTDDQLSIENFIDDPINSLANPIFFLAGEFFAAHGTGFLR
jgi:hypothetical protein